MSTSLEIVVTHHVGHFNVQLIHGGKPSVVSKDCISEQEVNQTLADFQKLYHVAGDAVRFVGEDGRPWESEIALANVTPESAFGECLLKLCRAERDYAVYDNRYMPAEANGAAFAAMTYHSKLSGIYTALEGERNALRLASRSLLACFQRDHQGGVIVLNMGLDSPLHAAVLALQALVADQPTPESEPSS